MSGTFSDKKFSFANFRVFWLSKIIGFIVKIKYPDGQSDFSEYHY